MKLSVQIIVAIAALVLSILVAIETYDFGKRIADSVGYDKFGYFFIIVIAGRLLVHLMEGKKS
jgi:hypothetical protein